MQDCNIIGCLIEYHPDNETKDTIFREDLKTNDPNRLMLVKESTTRH